MDPLAKQGSAKKGRDLTVCLLLLLLLLSPYRYFVLPAHTQACFDGVTLS